MDPFLPSVITQSLPSARWEFSFRPFLEFTQAQIRKTDNRLYRDILEHLLQVLKNTPDLLAPVSDLNLVSSRRREIAELIEASQASNFSEDAEAFYAVGIMNPFQFISLSDRFEEILFNSPECGISDATDDLMVENYVRQFYRELLKHCYGLDFDTHAPQQTLMRITEASYITRYHHLSVNTRFVTIKPVAELPPLQQEWVDFAKGSIESHENLSVKLDFSRFIVEGFLIFRITEATEEEALASLSSTVTNMHTMPAEDSFRNMRAATLSLLGEEYLEFGVLPFITVNSRPTEHSIFRLTSLLHKYSRKSLRIEDVYRIFYNSASHLADKSKVRPLVYNEDSGHLYSPFVKDLLLPEVKSLALFPMWHQDRLLGLVELISTQPSGINAAVLEKMERALPMFRELMVYRIDQVQDRINRFIMDEYTAIHPSVKWKFNEIAWQQISRSIVGDTPGPLPEIRFEHLHPFYGAVDVRNSSVLRQQALVRDFKIQLQELRLLLEQVGLNHPGPALDRRLEEVSTWQQRLDNRDMILIGEEEALQQVLEESRDWCNDWSASPEDIQAARNYAAAIDNRQSRFYRSANDYEQSLQHINATLKNVLEAAEQRLQEQVPHYFEHFKTDGWEYNIYAGQSISPGQPFPVDAFTSISRWQLETMIDLAVAAAREKKHLHFPLETTQLIYTHANNIDIYFRTDEHHFDVEGAYSIRYEVIKKRIDKVRIADTGQRLTQPGTIAVVYASAAVARIYEDHIRALIREGRLADNLEHIELEELQGIAGLRALRVRVNPPHLFAPSSSYSNADYHD